MRSAPLNTTATQQQSRPSQAKRGQAQVKSAPVKAATHKSGIMSSAHCRRTHDKAAASSAPAGSKAGIVAAAMAAAKKSEPEGPRIYTAPIPKDPLDECVYDLMPIFVPPEEKPARHRSKFAGMARQEYRTGTKPMASMGPIKAVATGPDIYLKKGDGEKVKPEVRKGSPDRVVRKAPLPKDPGVLPEPSGQNFIKSNIVTNINSVAKPPPKEPRKYLRKTNYGKTPPFVSQRQEEAAEAERQAAAAAEYEAEHASGLVLLPEDERLRIVEGLQANWGKLNSEYQRLSLTIDTVPKIARKVNLEQQLKRLEKDIQRFSQENIYVNLNAA
ncbi:hypothetical protein RI367_001392 [Sorochytrium milnesiophthora]